LGAKSLITEARDKKENGAYYTPYYIAEFFTQKIISFIKNNKTVNILEPSCGDGVFIQALLNNEIFNKKECGSISLVEKNLEELQKSQKYIQSFNKKNIQVNYYHDDFLNFQDQYKGKFDLILGNPPYIDRIHLEKQQIEKSKKLQAEFELNNSYFRNIWSAFVVGSIKLLNDSGSMCFILPAEMLQVKYADEIRKLLLESFSEIHIYSFREKIFEGIDQDVIVFIGLRNGIPKIEYHYFDDIHNMSSIESLSTSKITKVNKKWNWFILNDNESLLINELANSLNKVNDYCDSAAGIVTGNNKYFILNKEMLNKNKLEPYGIPIIQRSFFLRSRSLIIKQEHYEDIEKNGLPCYLLNFDRIMPKSKEFNSYIELGIRGKVNEQYKCKIRSTWYQIPSIWNSEGMFFKRSHLYPKLLLNPEGYFVTDTAYRIKMKDKFDIKSLIFSFYNSLTLLCSELNGRNYGGGVLELTPNEFKNLPIPYLKISDQEFNQLNNMFEEDLPIDDILDFTDGVILGGYLKIEPEKIKSIQYLRRKMVNYRLKKK
jgi:adenine-specific DNA-methyltransferase